MEAFEKRQMKIGAIMGNLDAPHAFELASGMIHASKINNVDLMFFPGMYAQSYYETSMLAERAKYDYQNTVIFDYINKDDCDVLIISMGTVRTFLDASEWEGLLKKLKGIPSIILEDTLEGYSSITIDNAKGMYDGLKHLIVDHNLTKIGFVGGNTNNFDAEQRLEVYYSIMKEYGLACDSSMVVHGNFTEYTDELVGKLLDDNPDLEGIAFANDMMALGGYREIKRRGLRVGKDIAVIGFDDYILSMSIDPPLTTVRASAYQLGFSATEHALKLIYGDEIPNIKIPSELIIRNSCGCKNLGTKLIMHGDAVDISDEKQYVESIVQNIVHKFTDQVRYNKIYGIMKRFVNDVLKLAYSNEEVENRDDKFIKLIRDLLSEEFTEFISIDKLYLELNQFIQRVVKNEQDSKKRNRLVDILTSIYEYITNYITGDYHKNNTRYKKDSWYATFIARDTMVYSTNEREAIYQIILKLKALQFQSAYIHLFEEPSRNYNDGHWKSPDKLFLASYFNKEEAIAFEPEERPIMTIGQSLDRFMIKEGRFTTVSFSLFANEEQYGILTCEIQLQEFSFAHTLGLQIGTALKFLHLMRKQMEMQKQLEDSLDIISRKNDLLSELSISDELTGLLNRRGLFEEIFTLIAEHKGGLAVMFFVDMDNLKGINDTFGHIEGDFSLKSIADILKKSFRSEDVIGRIGGDEFAAFALIHEPGLIQKVKMDINKLSDELNRTSGKPYYIEMSFGIKEFICHPGLNISDVLKEADAILYKDKKLKRKNFLKEQ